MNGVVDDVLTQGDPDVESGRPPIACFVGTCTVPLWGMTSAERLRRILLRAGVKEQQPWNGEVTPGRRHLLIRDDHVFDAILISDLAKGSNVILTSDDGVPVAAIATSDLAEQAATLLTTGGDIPAAMRAVTRKTLSSSYNNTLRKRETPYLMALTPENLPAIERRMFAGSYKGVTDLVTKYVWPAPALRVTRWCAKRQIRPNTVTCLSFALVLVAMTAFWHGWFITGLIAGWLMTFLDTVDGKLARVTLTSSTFGNIFDHGIDLIHPPFWYWAWLVGLQATGRGIDHLDIVLGIIVVGYVAQRLEELAFGLLFKVKMHVWKRFDSLFRLITARRNPNLLILSVSALAGQPDTGIVVVAAWTALCFLIHLVRIFQAFAASRRKPLRSWLDQ